MHRIQFPLKGEKKAKHKNQPSTEALQSILCLTRRKDPWHRLPDTETPSLGDAPVQPLPFPPPTLLVRWPGGAAMRNPHRVWGVCGVSEAKHWVQNSLKPSLPLEGIKGGLQGVGQTVLTHPSTPGWIVWEEGMDSIISEPTHPTQPAPDHFCGEKEPQEVVNWAFC